MPVGNSDQGVGLWAGQIMLSLDNTNEYIGWWHEEIDEGFDHEGDLKTIIFSPTVSIGLTDYWMLTLTQVIGNRSMNWGKDELTNHHRTEDSSTNFDNADGGWLGDTRLKLRYLVLNTGSGEGYRFFLGGGITIPSKNTLTSSPFLNPDEDHRHFSLSEGAYKGNLEFQLYKKQNNNPVFYGTSIVAGFPLKESKYRFKPSSFYDFALTILFKKIAIINGSLGANVILRRTTQAYWNDKKAPNSESTSIIPGISYIRNTNRGVFTFNLHKPFFVSGSFANNEGELDQSINAFLFTIGYRKVLDYTIPWLYF